MTGVWPGTEKYSLPLLRLGPCNVCAFKVKLVQIDYQPFDFPSRIPHPHKVGASAQEALAEEDLHSSPEQ